MHPSKNTFLGFLLGNLLGISQRVFPPKFPPKLLIKTPLMTIPDLSWAFFKIFFHWLPQKKITVIYENLYRNSSRKRSRKLFINDWKKKWNNSRDIYKRNSGKISEEKVHEDYFEIFQRNPWKMPGSISIKMGKLLKLLLQHSQVEP